ncbi:carboxyltransferase domain-containing protein [Helicobacter sp. 11S02629-2]|uniref:5-oxoprolinase subunit B family protein n=1 Tax=Helicobacter sp. 11S02629-2 TaxID=1476195 RepID=UPI000BA797A0|nr:carboxyltransferase domain-containing protein [Helicobacter sp. 11S02629-2]PAF44887.1 allophanate hydrolase [Helicobacter sp. 11S02629-2]
MGFRYSLAGDEFIFVEIEEDMSLEAFFKALEVTNKLKALKTKGIVDICPANASYQVRYNPDLVNGKKLLETLKDLEANLKLDSINLDTRVIEVPVFYNDPYTKEVVMRFRDRHQDPNLTDIEYTAKINGLKSVDELILKHSTSPWIVTMVGFVAGLPWFYQMVDRKDQIEAPKYLSPRTDTLQNTIGHAGCFAVTYSVRGGGGYQQLGITPMFIYNPDLNISYFNGALIFHKPGDIVKFKVIDDAEYKKIGEEIKKGEYKPNIKPLTFSYESFQKDKAGYNKQVIDILEGRA